MTTDNKLDKVLDKIDTMHERVESIDKTLALNTESLVTHIKRTDILEGYVKAELAPIKEQVNMVRYGSRAILWLGSAIAGIAGFLYILQQMGVKVF